LASKVLRKKMEAKGLAVPKGEKALLKGRVYKQEMEHSEERPTASRWERIHCALYETALVYYRDKDSKKPLDIVTLNEDFLIRKVKTSSSSSSQSSSSKSKSKKRTKKRSDKKIKDLSHLFLVTDLEHVNHYFGTNGADAKNRWVEKLTEVITRHQKKAEKREASKKRKSAFQKLHTYGYSKSHGIEGTGMSKAELRRVGKLNSDISREVEDIKLMRDSWREEALRLRKLYEDEQRRVKKERKTAKNSGKRLNDMMDELQVRGYEREIQAMSTIDHKRELKRLKRKLKNRNHDIQDMYMSQLEDAALLQYEFSSDSDQVDSDSDSYLGERFRKPKTKSSDSGYYGSNSRYEEDSSDEEESGLYNRRSMPRQRKSKTKHSHDNKTELKEYSNSTTWSDSESDSEFKNYQRNPLTMKGKSSARRENCYSSSSDSIDDDEMRYYRRESYLSDSSDDDSYS